MVKVTTEAYVNNYGTMSANLIRPRKVERLTFLNSLLRMASALGVEMTGKPGSIFERGVRVLTWQWSSRLCVISKQSRSGRSCSCLRKSTRSTLIVISTIFATSRRNHHHLKVLQDLLSSIKKPRLTEVQVAHENRVHQDVDPAQIPQPAVALNIKCTDSIA